MSALRFYPLAELPHIGLLAKRGEKPAPARFLTPEKARALAQLARESLG